MSGFMDNSITAGRQLADNRGFNLVELIVVMGIFVTVMLITTSSFKTIIHQSSQQSKSIETNIEGIVGLEVLRADLEQAGFGLPWTFQTPITYAEANLGTSMPAASYWIGAGSAEDFNDSPSAAPRAIQSGNTNFNNVDNVGAKYIVIKSTTTATNDAAKKWTNLSIGTGGVKTIRVWNSSLRDFLANERVIVLKNNLITTPPSRQLMATSAASFSARFSNYSVLAKPLVEGDTFQVYGVAAATSPVSDTVRMPFNRSDYYVMRPSTAMPEGCAPKTGVLYKSSINQSPTSGGGGYSPTIPLLDCVADMQIVYGLDTSGSGSVNLHDITAPATAADQRSQVREVRVYILAQDGKKDIMYSYPSATVNVGETINGVFRGRIFDLSTLGSGWQQYRWKVYTIVVRPKNLIQ